MFQRHRQRIIITGIMLLLVIGILIIVLDWQNTRAVLQAADWKKSGFALLFIAGSYFFLSYGYAVVNRVFGIKLNRVHLFDVGFVSAALNNLLDTMGMGGHALRIMLMDRSGVSSSQTLAASIFHSHIHNLGMFCVLPVGLIYLIVNRLVPPAMMVWLGVFTVIIIAFIIVATLVVFKRSLRIFVINLLSKLMRFVTRRDSSSFFTTFDEAMSAGVAVLQDKTRTLLLILFCVAAEWAFMLVGFWFCFGALGSPVSPGILITGFAVGISVGNVSMLPGGLGIQEASMAGVYAALGVPFERGVLVSLLFRTVYDFIPFIISLFFYRGLLKITHRHMKP
ncbi:MAG: flippase-like domain-containing protein [Dehalococcoidales bacterium]|nr:flippase-like domain-containing protein [Dehalococcoidales bacterium]